MGDVNRPLRRLFAYSHPPQGKALLPLSSAWGGLAVSSNAVRLSHGSSRVHSSSERVQGFRLNVYLDDWINRNLQYSLAVRSMIRLLILVIHMGFLPNFQKSSLEPVQRFDFVEYHYDLVRGLVLPPQS